MNPDTLKPKTNNPAEAAFNKLHFSPDVEIVDMSQNSVLRVAIPEGVNGVKDDGVEYLALLGVPSEQDRDTVLGIFKGSDGQIYISNGEDGVEPVLIHRNTRLTIGRAGVFVDTPGVNGKVLRSRIDLDPARSLIAGFGEQTSREHLIIDLDKDGKLYISDISTSGTKAILPKNTEVAKFVNGLKVSTPRTDI